MEEYKTILEIIESAKEKIIEETVNEFLESGVELSESMCSWTEIDLGHEIYALNHIGRIAGERFNQPYSDLKSTDCFKEFLKKYKEKKVVDNRVNGGC